MKVAIIGAGAYGTALGGILAGKGYDIDYYDPLKERERLKDTVSSAKAILLTAPSDIVMKLLSHLPKETFLIVATKGFLSDKPFVDFEDWAVLSGAGFADDIKAGKPITLTATDKRVVEMFENDHINVELTPDRKGVLMCGALKNIYALGAGLRELHSGTKKIKDYLRQALNEMGMILQENGGRLRTLRLSCGLEDLVLTACPNSRNYKFGLELKHNPDAQPEATVESVMALHRIREGEVNIPDEAIIMNELIEKMREIDRR